MSFIKDLKSSFNIEEEQQTINNLPWEENIISGSKNEENKINTKKIACVGLAILIIIIIIYALFNYFSNSQPVSLDTTSSSEEINKKIKLQVHVAGEVNKPGVYKLDEGSRIIDAINAAGGFTNKANQSSLNLAKLIEDGEQIKIDAIETTESQYVPNGSNNNENSNGKININTADLAQLQTLSGVGPSTAQKILDYRSSNGKFKSIEDLKKVSGIGEKTFEKLKDKICV